MIILTIWYLYFYYLTDNPFIIKPLIQILIEMIGCIFFFYYLVPKFKSKKEVN